jgi:predicted phage tail protein
MEGRNVYWRWIPTAEEFKISSYNNYAAAKGNRGQPIVRTFKMEGLENGYHYEVRITRITDDDTDATKYMSDLYYVGYREMTFGYTANDWFIYPYLAKLGVHALASEQLSGSLSILTLIEGRKIKTWNGSSWVTQFSTNPAWIVWDILTNTRYGAGIDESRLDLDSFYEWAQYCDELVDDGDGGTEKRWEFNGVFDAETTAWEAALDVCQVGKGCLVWNGINIFITIDKAADPVQLFNSGNIVQDSFQQSFLPMDDRATEIEVHFADRDNDYERNTVVVIDPDSDKSNKVTLTLMGVTKASQAWRDANYRMLVNKYLTQIVKFSVDVEAIACTVGDVIMIQHDVPQWGFGGRVVEADENSVTLDQEVTIEAGKSYTIMIKYDDDTTVTKTVINTPGTYTVLTVSTPFSTVPSKYNAFVFGEVDKMTKNFRVAAITRSADLVRDITAIEYNALIYVDGVPEIPAIDYSSLPARLAAVEDLAASELVEKAQDGTVNAMVEVSFTIPDNPFWSYAEIWVRDGATWLYKGRSDDGYAKIGPLQEGKTYAIAAVSVNEVGQKQRVEDAEQVELYVYGKLAPPGDVDGFMVTRTGESLLFVWNPVTDDDLAGYEIREGSSWLVATIVASMIQGTVLSIPYIGWGSKTWFIKAIDTSGNYSENATMISVTLDQPFNWHPIITELIGDSQIEDVYGLPRITYPFQGTFENMIYAGGIGTPGIRPDAPIKAKDLGDTAAKDYGTLPAWAVGGTLGTGVFISEVIDLGAEYLAGIDWLATAGTRQVEEPVPACISQFEVSFSNDNITWTGWANLTKTATTFRYVKFRVTITSEEEEKSPMITAFSVTIYLPLRTKTFEDEAVGLTPTHFTFGITFHDLPAISITLQDAEAGDYPVITNKAVDGVDIQIKDTNGNFVERSIDLIIQGY